MSNTPRRHPALSLATGILALVVVKTTTEAAPYASGIKITGTTVEFILNEPSDTLTYSINGGASITLDGSAKGLKTFTLGSATDKFAISVTKNDLLGYTIPTGGTAPVAANGLSQPSAAGGFNLISNDSDTLVRFNSPRGVAVATNPANPQFGTAYVSNSAAGTSGGRSVGDGLYGVKADQSDAFGNGDVARTTGFETGTASASSPFRIAVGGDHNVYIADFSDAYGGIYRMSGTLTNSTQVLSGLGGPTSLPAGQNHGSTVNVVASGSASGLTLFTVDEDLTSGHVAGGAATTDRNSIWKYDLGASALPYSTMPTKFAAPLLNIAGVVSDMERATDGKFYLSQFRSNGLEAGLIVLSDDGSTVLFNSLNESRSLLGNPTAADIFRNVQGVAVSPDQKYLALMLNSSDVAILPLDSFGIPLIADRLVIDSATDIASGRDIAFDAAGNIHYVSSGQALYRVFSPGGFTSATTSWDGSALSFVVVPEPSSLLLLGAGSLLLARRRRAAMA